jgi:hypothetical protein
MIYNFHNLRYCIWDLDFSNFKEKIAFDKSLEIEFDAGSKRPYPVEAVGSAYSASLFRIKEFGNFLEYITPNLDYHLTTLGKPIYKRMVRAWGNRMHRDSRCTVHAHKGSNVLIVYYKVPENSADLVFVDPIYEGVKNLNQIPESAKRYINVKEGMCLLHDGDILHGVNIHNSDQTRDSLILEFKCYETIEEMENQIV